MKWPIWLCMAKRNYPFSLDEFFNRNLPAQNLIAIEIDGGYPSLLSIRITDCCLSLAAAEC